MTPVRAMKLLAVQPIGTFYITNNLNGIRLQTETVCVKIAEDEWEEYHDGHGIVYAPEDIADEMAGGEVAWALY